DCGPPRVLSAVLRYAAPCGSLLNQRDFWVPVFAWSFGFPKNMGEALMNGVPEKTAAKSFFNKLFQHNPPFENILAGPLPQRPNFLLETLESRLLLSADLSTIVWANRGQASDNFDTAFGAGAPADAARAVVDAAIDAWDRVVVNFHHAAGIGPPDLSETIS